MYQTNLRRVIKWTKIQTIVHRTKTTILTTITIQTTQAKTQAKTQTTTQARTQTTITTRTTTTRKQEGESHIMRFPFLLTQSLPPLNIERRMQEDKYETI